MSLTGYSWNSVSHISIYYEQFPKEKDGYRQKRKTKHGYNFMKGFVFLYFIGNIVLPLNIQYL